MIDNEILMQKLLGKNVWTVAKNRTGQQYSFVNHDFVDAVPHFSFDTANTIKNLMNSVSPNWQGVLKSGGVRHEMLRRVNPYSTSPARQADLATEQKEVRDPYTKDAIEGQLMLVEDPDELKRSRERAVASENEDSAARIQSIVETAKAAGKTISADDRSQILLRLKELGLPAGLYRGSRSDERLVGISDSSSPHQSETDPFNEGDSLVSHILPNDYGLSTALGYAKVGKGGPGVVTYIDLNDVNEATTGLLENEISLKSSELARVVAEGKRKAVLYQYGDDVYIPENIGVPDDQKGWSEADRAEYKEWEQENKARLAEEFGDDDPKANLAYQAARNEFAQQLAERPFVRKADRAVQYTLDGSEERNWVDASEIHPLRQRMEYDELEQLIDMSVLDIGDLMKQTEEQDNKNNKEDEDLDSWRRI